MRLAKATTRRQRREEGSHSPLLFFLLSPTHIPAFPSSPESSRAPPPPAERTRTRLRSGILREGKGEGVVGGAIWGGDLGEFRAGEG